MATLVRWEPFRELASLHNEMSRVMNGLFEGSGTTNGRGQAWAPAVDVWETEDELVYAFDLPGIPEDKIDVQLENDMLTVSAVRERTDEKQDDRYYRFERRFGSFLRTIGVPQGVTDEDIEARYANGVLEIRVAKPEIQKPRRIPVGAGTQAAIEGTATKSES